MNALKIARAITGTLMVLLGVGGILFTGGVNAVGSPVAVKIIIGCSWMISGITVVAGGFFLYLACTNETRERIKNYLFAEE